MKDLRVAYKESIIVTRDTDNIRVNLSELSRVVLECMERRLVDAAFNFSYGRFDDEASMERFSKKTGKCLSDYGMTALILVSKFQLLWFQVIDSV